MRFMIGLTFDIDPADWADIYSLPDTTAAIADVEQVLRLAAIDGTLAHTVVTGWPMLRDAATMAAVAPGEILAAIAADATVLAVETRHDIPGPLCAVVLDQVERARHARIVFAVRRAVREALDCGEITGTTPEAVVFTAAFMDDGFFLSDTAMVHFADGSVADVQDAVDSEDLNPGGAYCGPGAALGVNLATGEVFHNPYGVGPVLAALRVAVPNSRTTADGSAGQ